MQYRMTTSLKSGRGHCDHGSPCRKYNTTVSARHRYTGVLSIQPASDAYNGKLRTMVVGDSRSNCHDSERHKHTNGPSVAHTEISIRSTTLRIDHASQAWTDRHETSSTKQTVFRNLVLQGHVAREVIRTSETVLKSKETHIFSVIHIRS